MNDFIWMGCWLILPLIVYRVVTSTFNYDTPGVMFQMLGSLFLIGICCFVYGAILGEDNATP